MNRRRFRLVLVVILVSSLLTAALITTFNLLRPPGAGERARAAAPAAGPVTDPQAVTVYATYTSTHNPMPIPPQGCPDHATATIFVEADMYVDDLNVGLNLSAPARTDLSIYLQSPGGKLVQLFSASGGGYENLDVWLDQDLGEYPTLGNHNTAAPYYEVTWLPLGPLSLFDNEPSLGEWTLGVCTKDPLQGTMLNFWTLDFHLTGPFADLTGSTKEAPLQNRLGDPITYEIITRNTGRLPTENTSLVDKIPNGARFVPGSLSCFPSGCSYDPAGPEGPAVYWSGVVQPGGVATTTFQVNYPYIGRVENRVQVSDPLLWEPLERVAATSVVSHTYFAWDFDRDDGGFSPNGEWQWGDPGAGIGSPFKILSVWGTDLAGHYDPGTSSVLSKVVDLRTLQPRGRVILEWWEWYALPGTGDYAVISANGQNLIHYGGLSNGWKANQVDLTPFAGQEVTLKWMLTANTDRNFDRGWYLDNVSVYLEPPTPPRIYSISPEYGLKAQETPVEITGDAFVSGAVAYLGDTPLALNTFTSPRLLKAVVPAGLAAGTYNLRVVNPDGAQGILLEAFTVLAPEPPHLASISPARGLADTPVNVDIFGGNFSPGTQAYLRKPGEIDLPLEAVTFINSNHLRATVPPGLEPMLYHLVVSRPDESSDILLNAYRVMDPAASDDLWSLGETDLWIDPPSVQAGENLELGQTVRRLGGLDPLTTVAVDFYLGAPSTGQGGVFLGRAFAGPLAPRQSLPATLPWEAVKAGSYSLFAVLDPENQVPELNENNNITSRAWRILPADPTTIPLQVTSFMINGGDPATAARQVSLDVTAQAVPPSGSPPAARAAAAEPASVLYVEYRFDQAAGGWVAAGSSGWRPYAAAHAGFLWNLYPTPGAHYVQAWVADAAGNIGPLPGLAQINLQPYDAPVSRTEVHIYRFPLLAGSQVTVRLTSWSGDADLYVFDPQGQLIDRRETGEPVEEITFTPAVTGLYQVEVEGFVTASYSLELGETLPAAAGGPARPRPQMPTPRGRGVPFTNSVPNNDTGVPDAPVSGPQIFLPYVGKVSKP